MLPITGEHSLPLRYRIDFDFNILTALKGWVGQAAKRTGALHIIIIYFIIIYSDTADEREVKIFYTLSENFHIRV